ncbi:MAG: flavodoxin family protein [Candidatus Thorarchaeota archaeon]|nr:flavodoxin family protein [Candidatus Thorarchaeota archaeon]
MLIVGISGSPKKEKSNCKFLLQEALNAASEVLSDGKETENSVMLLELSNYEIRRCTGCDACVRKHPCPESSHDDMPELEMALLQANAIIIAAPSYFTSVPGILKDFLDRTRTVKMLDHQLKDKLFGVITYAGLRYGGQEHVVDMLNRYALGQGMIVVGSVGSPVMHGTFGSGSMQTDEGNWRQARDDQLAIEASRILGRRIAELVKKIGAEAQK